MLHQDIFPLPSEYSEEMLVRQSLAGDQDAFAILVSHYESRLLGYIRLRLRRSGSTDQAYDVLQYVLLQLYRSLPTLSGHSSLGPWLFRVAHNRCLDELRRQRRRTVLFSELDNEISEEGHSLLAFMHDIRPLPEEVAEQREIQQEFGYAIEALPQKYRSIVLLRYLYDLSFREIGQRLNMPESTAKTYFHRARPLLRVALTRS